MGPGKWWREVWISISLAPFNWVDWKLERWNGFAMLYLGPLGLSIGYPVRELPKDEME